MTSFLVAFQLISSSSTVVMFLRSNYNRPQTDSFCCVIVLIQFINSGNVSLPLTVFLCSLFHEIVQQNFANQMQYVYTIYYHQLR